MASLIRALPEPGGRVLRRTENMLFNNIDQELAVSRAMSASTRRSE